MSAENTLYWHDYETFGSDPRRDRPCQFAGVRTDEELNVIGDPVVLYCHPPADALPDPESCLITGISPRRALEAGVNEAAFSARVLRELALPGTCGCGYNSIRFDDEVTRRLLYRNFHDPYEREWRNGNSRWDIIDMVRLAYALRPEGIHWPAREDGTASFRLEDLTRENGIPHAGAHDALTDVRATIDLARLIRARQPKLYQYLYHLRHKRAVLPLLNLANPRPVLHVSARYPAGRGCMAVVLPLLRHPLNQNGVIVCDLAADPGDWLDADAGDIRRRLFTPRKELAEGKEGIPLKTVHVNRCPVLAPLSVLTAEAVSRWDIDLERCERHWKKLEGARGLRRKLAEVYAEPEQPSPVEDPDLMLYIGGFFSDSDRALMREVPHLSPAQLADYRPDFHDKRLPEMLFRYRARNFPESLNPDERRGWDECRGARLLPGAGGMAWGDFWSRLDDLKACHPDRGELLSELGDYALGLGKELGLSRQPLTGAAT